MKALVASNEVWRFAVCRGLAPIWPGVAFSGCAPVRLLDIASAESPPSGWCRVRVHQCGLCASDLHLIRAAISPRVAPAAVLGDPRLRSILGHELVGTITAGGTDGLPIGTRVISRSGGFRNCFNLNRTPCTQCALGDYSLCEHQGTAEATIETIRGGGFASQYDEAPANLLPVPATLSDDEALLAEPLACSLRAVLKLQDNPPRRILVIGAGLQGLGAIHWLRHLHPTAELWVTARYKHQGERAKALGANIIAPGAIDMPQMAGHLGTSLIENPRGNALLADGFDAVIDSIGNSETLQAGLRMTRPGGQMVILGAHLDRGCFDYSPIWFREVRLSGVYAHGMEHWRGTGRSTLELALELLAGPAKLPVELVTHHLPLREYSRAVRLMEQKSSSQAVRVALTPD